MIIIDGVSYNVPIVGDTIDPQVIDKYAERTEDGVLHHEVLGVYHNFEVEFAPIIDPELHQRFFNDLTAPSPERTVTLPGMYTTYTTKCYIRVSPVSMRRHRPSGNMYDGLKVKFIAIAPARRG